MTYRGPLATLRSYDSAPRPPLFPPSPVSNLSLFLSLPLCRRSSLLTGGRGAESFDREKSWLSISNSILSVVNEAEWQTCHCAAAPLSDVTRRLASLSLSPGGRNFGYKIKKMSVKLTFHSMVKFQLNMPHIEFRHRPVGSYASGTLSSFLLLFTSASHLFLTYDVHDLK
jgi:hypothetical protein